MLRLVSSALRHSAFDALASMLSILRRALFSAPSAPPSAALMVARGFKTKTKGGVKKRFHARANGMILYKPGGRSHNLQKHSRSRNRRKGAAITVGTTGVNGDLWTRLRGMGMNVTRRLASRRIDSDKPLRHIEWKANHATASAIGKTRAAPINRFATPTLSPSNSAVGQAWSYVVKPFVPQRPKPLNIYAAPTAGKQSFR